MIYLTTIVAGRNHYPNDIELTVERSGAPVRPGACVAISESINGVEELVIIAEVDERRMQTEGSGAEALNEFWASAVKTIKGVISTGHGLALRSMVFVEPRSLEKTSSGKPRRRYYQKLYSEGKLAVIHEQQSPLIN